MSLSKIRVHNEAGAEELLEAILERPDVFDYNTLRALMPYYNISKLEELATSLFEYRMNSIRPQEALNILIFMVELGAYTLPTTVQKLEQFLEKCSARIGEQAIHYLFKTLFEKLSAELFFLFSKEAFLNSSIGCSNLDWWNSTLSAFPGYILYNKLWQQYLGKASYDPDDSIGAPINPELAYKIASYAGIYITETSITKLPASSQSTSTLAAEHRLQMVRQTEIYLNSVSNTPPYKLLEQVKSDRDSLDEGAIDNTPLTTLVDIKRRREYLGLKGGIPFGTESGEI